MAVVNGYTGWATNVNRIILDSTTITLGDSATKSDELENGQKRTRLRSSFCPDKYSVTMEFNWLQKDSNGKTELQRFYEWYKYNHKYGTIPFEFPQILYSPQSGIKSQDDSYNNYRTEYYKITSAVEGSKRGEDIQIKMTWESVYGGTISIEEGEDEISYASGHFGYIDVVFSHIKETEPVSADFSLQIDINNILTNVSIDGYYFDGTDTARLYFSAANLDRTKDYDVTVTYGEDTVETVIHKES